MKGQSMTANRPYRDQSYEIFLQGIDAYKLKAPRRAPKALCAPGEDNDAALWLAGYDMERDEQRDLDRFNARPDFMDFDIPIWD